jgi:hypothetical protein
VRIFFGALRLVGALVVVAAVLVLLLLLPVVAVFVLVR